MKTVEEENEIIYLTHYLKNLINKNMFNFKVCNNFKF